MYPVSEAFLQAVQGNTRKYYWTGKITTTAGLEYPFTQKDIVKGSGYITAQCCGNSEIELGAVYAAEMGISLFLDIDRYTLEDAKIELTYHLRLADGTYEEVPMGIFEVSEANRTAHVLELKAYDYMLRFDRDFNGFETIGTAYGMMALCSTACGVELAQRQTEIEALPNGSELLSIYPENDIETYRDVLYFTAQVLGGFFCINRDGKLEFRQYGNTPVMEILQKHRFSSSFSDFVTRYTAVSSTNLRTQTSEYYALEEDDGLTMNLGVNPLLQFGLEETREELCWNILTALSMVNYVPFDSDTIGNPALDLGDVLIFSGGQADARQVTCVTSFTIKIGGRQSLKCVGKNPRLSPGKVQNDKKHFRSLKPDRGRENRYPHFYQCLRLYHCRDKCADHQHRVRFQGRKSCAVLWTGHCGCGGKSSGADSKCHRNDYCAIPDGFGRYRHGRRYGCRYHRGFCGRASGCEPSGHLGQRMGKPPAM